MASLWTWAAKRPLGALLAIVAVSSFALFGCQDDGGEPLTLNAYAQAYVSVDRTYEGSVAPLRTDLDTAFAGLSDSDAVPQEVIDLLNALADEDESFADELADLEAPGEAENLHDEAVSTLRAHNEAVKDALGGVDTSTTVGDLNARLTSQDVSDAAQRRFEACLEVQEFVNGQGVSVDLAC
jgi:hypothetical protein